MTPMDNEPPPSWPPSPPPPPQQPPPPAGPPPVATRPVEPPPLPDWPEAPPVQPPLAPPVLPLPTPPPLLPTRRPRWRAAVFLVLVGFYPLFVGLLGYLMQSGRADRGPALPPDAAGLVLVCVESVAVFAVFFGFGAWVGRPTRSELFWRPLRWRDWLWGALWSIGVRLGAVVMVYGALLPVWIAEALRSKAAAGGSAGPSVEERLQEFRPRLESLLQFDALGDPLYLLLAVTLLSFITAGLREELWRAGFMAAVRDLLPDRWWTPRPRDAAEGWFRWQARRWGPTVSVALLAAVIFGLGHLPQGAGGVVLTGVVGFILAMVMIGHRSIWVAVLAHGFFDASTFVLLAVIVRNQETIRRLAPDLLKQLGM